MPKETANVLDPRGKNIIFNALKTIQAPQLHAALINAALNGESFPTDCKEFAELCKLHFHMTLETVKADLNNAIHKYIDLSIRPLFQKMLTETFEATKWRSSFLLFLANELKINVNTSPLVQLAIKEGKIYWRITHNGTVLYDRSAHKKQHFFDFTNANLISMTWEQFRIFKDSGKRGGSVAITQELFLKAFPVSQQKAATDTWIQLKQKGILDHNDRLSQRIWHFASSSDLNLDDPHLDYKSNPTTHDAKNIQAFRDTYPKLSIAPGIILAPVERIYPITSQCFAVPFDLIATS